MTLIIDAGNSRLKICAWNGREDFASADQHFQQPLQDLFSFGRPHDANQAKKLSLAFREFLQDFGTEKSTRVALVSTVPDLTSLILMETPDVKVIDHTASFPFGVSLQNPVTVGPDRFCNMAAAVGAGLNTALVVDAGTATTFDLLLDGEFRGGLIAPGMAFAAQKLGEEASLLSPVPFAACPLIPGKNTTSAMAAGAFHVGVQGVQGVIGGLLEQYGELPVVLTGGLGRYLSHCGASYDPHWTQRGAAVLAGF